MSVYNADVPMFLQSSMTHFVANSKKAMGISTPVRAFAVLLWLLSTPVFSQTPAGFTQYKIAGEAVASQYGEWTILASSPVDSSGIPMTIDISSPTVTLAGGPIISPIRVGTALLFVDPDGSSEIIVPMVVNCPDPTPGLPCQLTAVFQHRHPGKGTLRSASDGLQEAIDDISAGGGGIVRITPDWTGTASQILAAVVPSNVLIRDERQGKEIWYASNGTHPQSIAGLGGSGTTVATLESIRYADQWCSTPQQLDQTCIQNAIVDLHGSPGTIVLPAGIYQISAPLTVPITTDLRLSNGAIFQIKDGISLQILGPFHAGRHTVFQLSGTGTASFTGNTAVDTVLPQWWGAVGDGLTDSTSAFASALAAGAPLYIPPGMYHLAKKGAGTAAIVYSGRVRIRGDGPASIIKCDGLAFAFDGADGSSITDIAFQAATTPTVVTPSQLPTTNPNEVVVLDRFGTGTGYQPTVNDGDIWGQLSTTQHSQDFSTGLLLQNSSHVTVERITGEYYSLLFYDVSDSRVSDNRVMGGKNFIGAIAFWHVSGGAGNNRDLIQNNIVRYASYSGIMIGGTTHTTVANNIVEYNGESGIKTGQGNTEQCSDITITGNVSHNNWYDGFDLSSNYPHTGTFIADSAATGNRSSANHHTGFFMDGQNWTVTGNSVSDNYGTGMLLDLNNSVISANLLSNNNSGNAQTGAHQIILGSAFPVSGNTLADNQINAAPGTNGYAIYVSGTNLVEGNTASNLTFFSSGSGNTFRGNQDSNGAYFDSSSLQQSSSSSSVGQILRGNLGQTANLSEWQNEAGQLLASIDASGEFHSLASAPSGPTPGSGAALGWDFSGTQSEVNFWNATAATQNQNVAFDWRILDAANVIHEIASLDRNGVLSAAGGMKTSQLTIANDAPLSAAPRILFPVFLPGPLSSDWTAANWTPDMAVVITRVQVDLKTAPQACTANAVLTISDGTSPLTLNLTSAANDSGPLDQLYAAGSTVTAAISAPAAGCSVMPADAQILVQYRMN